MTEQLSRVRSRQKQRKREEQPPVQTNKRTPASNTAAERTDNPVVAAGTLSRKDRLSGRRASRRPEREAVQQEGEDTPSRTQSYPSERIRFSKMFVNSLIVLFLMLLGFLLWWGFAGAPELRKLWN
ncbi:hypothetical protein HQN87_05840 [Paenibacillus tritici]|jgi:cobalamin biosynthesis Mg chelatase CobN|uniref:Uncharacterized protein n=1 Tax=Paenibacillus tritici TaxID=1873425 RepID=A0ABX2DJT8_9BACL|nr:hypothetical protein [Paenibacillus tritici]NQX44842.1 hypothetical protein [Paenibacillus tritici]QUL52908.1 hypothetical protein KDC22_21050 [Paenibacillus tritici]